MKERLLGAAVLVLAAVLIIPALLDGPEREDAQVSRELALPAPQSATTRTHVVDLDAGAGPETPQTMPDAPAAATTSAANNPEPARNVAPARDAPVSQAPERPAPEPVAQPRVEPAPAAAPAQQGWAVQVGSFTSETNARRLAGLLQASDYPAFVARNVVEGRVMYRVRVGPEPDRERAEALAERLREDRQQTQLVRHP